LKHLAQLAELRQSSTSSNSASASSSSSSSSSSSASVSSSSSHSVDTEPKPVPSSRVTPKPPMTSSSSSASVSVAPTSSADEVSCHVAYKACLASKFCNSSSAKRKFAKCIRDSHARRQRIKALIAETRRLQESQHRGVAILSSRVNAARVACTQEWNMCISSTFCSSDHASKQLAKCIEHADALEQPLEQPLGRKEPTTAIITGASQAVSGGDLVNTIHKLHAKIAAQSIIIKGYRSVMTSSSSTGGGKWSAVMPPPISFKTAAPAVAPVAPAVAPVAPAVAPVAPTDSVSSQAHLGPNLDAARDAAHKMAERLNIEREVQKFGQKALHALWAQKKENEKEIHSLKVELAKKNAVISKMEFERQQSYDEHQALIKRLHDVKANLVEEQRKDQEALSREAEEEKLKNAKDIADLAAKFKIVVKQVERQDKDLQNIAHQLKA